MDKPVILAVDDELVSLAIVERELRKRYGADYRVVAKQSPQDALDELQHIAEGGGQTALVLADQWMPGMSGTDFLGAARLIDPQAKRVMLVSWGDASAGQAILEGCAVGQIQSFLAKPWHSSPDERFHHSVGEFLYSWAREHRPVFEAVRIIGEQWSRRSHELRDLLGRNGISYGFYAADSDEGRELLLESGLDSSAKLPVAIVFGGRVLMDPSHRELSEALGVQSASADEPCDVLVIGGGPGGLAAAVYASSEGLATLLLEREALGGQAGQSTLINNYLGFPTGVSGDDLASRAYEQAWQFGTRFLFANEATGIAASPDGLAIQLGDGAVLSAASVIIATGISYRRLGVPRLEELQGSGVFYGSVSSEARSLPGFDVFIVGAGNSAGQAAMHLAKYARQVTILSRAGSLEDTMSKYLIMLIEGADKVAVRYNTRIVDGDGEGRLMHLTVEDTLSGERETLPAQALFVMIGARPHTGWLPAEVARDEQGYVLTGRDVVSGEFTTGWSLERLPFTLETSLPGVFAVGDVRHGSIKRVASAAGEGAMAVRYCHEYLQTAASHRAA